MSSNQLDIDILLYVALAEEFDALSEALTEDLKVEPQVVELSDLALHVFSYEVPSPTLGRSVKLGVVPAGKMGITRASNVVSAILDRSNCNDVVVLGIAGSLSDDLQPGDVLVPDSVNEYLANSAAINDEKTGQWVFQTSGNPHLATPQLLNRFQLFKSIAKHHFQNWEADCAARYEFVATKEVRGKMEEAGFTMRAVIKLFAGDDRKLASGPAVGKSEAFVKWLKADVDRKIVAIEMESAGVFDAAAIRTPSPRVLAIRGISDFADERKKLIEDGAKDQFRAVAAKNALSLLLRGIEAGFFLPKPKTLGGTITPLEHWELILTQGEDGDPPLPAKLFTHQRASACDALEAVFTGKSKRVLLYSESEHDVDDFVAAYLSTLENAKAKEYGNRCLFISNEEAWKTASEFSIPHILVASPRLGLDAEQKDLQSVATKKGHGVVIPLCGPLTGDNSEIIELKSPSRNQIESILKEANFTEVRARELAGISGGRVSALRRHLLGLGAIPPYSNWSTARELAQAALAGQWNAKSVADVSAMGDMLGKDYGKWVEGLRPATLRSDSPLIQSNEKWRFVARGESWSALGKHITDADLDRFEEAAVKVLQERNPQFDLPKEERYAASIHGKALVHSSDLRKGITETLALLGCRAGALCSCTLEKAETTAILVVRRLLKGANWERWASLNSHLPLLAEAAPDEFLDAVESVLESLEATPFREIFVQEGGGVLGGTTYMSGLLWALETLAWDANNLSRVAVILADLASIDPGGNWSNRPANSLVDIFLPWHFQTTAPFQKRVTAVKAVIREHPEVGWNLILGLLPSNHGWTSGCHRPVWRTFIPRDWKVGVLTSEYSEQIAAFTDLAVQLAKESTDKLQELINRLPDLPQSAHESLLTHLGSAEIRNLSETERLPLWEKLEDLVRRHRKYADTDWALSEEVVVKIEEAANNLAPDAPELKYHHLFSDRDFDLFDEKGDYDAQRQRLDEARQTPVKAILDAGALSDVLSFSEAVTAPYEVGRALAAIASEEIESEVIPSMLNEAPDSNLGRMAAGFVWARYWIKKWDWVDAVLERDWNATAKAAFFVRLPFEDEVWQRVAKHLGESDEGLYWTDAWVNPYGPDRDLTVPIEKLLQYGRPSHALLCVARTANSGDAFSETLAIQALIAILDTPGSIGQLDNYRTVEVIKRLQKSKTADQVALFKIEWNFLPWLDRFSTGSPVTLEKKIASDPVFFSEVMSFVYRSRNEEGFEPDEADEADEPDAPDEQSQYLARNGYKLLSEWHRVPGTQDDGTFDVAAFNEWITEARRITVEAGRAEVAQIQIGHVLTRAPADPGGLWIHETVADLLNHRDTGEMRSGFTTQLFNDRGVHGFTHGEDERKIASENRIKADALDSKGYTRFATVMREFAERYERQAEREAKRNPFED